MQLKNSGVYFDKDSHQYWLDNKELNGITGMLSRQLFKDKYSSVPSYILNRAAERGERIHTGCFTYDMFGSVNDEEVQWYADLKEKEQFEVHESEYIVTDRDYFATAIDKIITISGVICLGDIKTTYVLDKEYLSWQLSINAYLFELQNPGLKVGGLYAIYIRDGAKLVEIERKPDEVVKSLLEAEKEGRQFENPYALVVSDKDSEQALHLVKELAEIAHSIEQLKDVEKEYKDRIEKLFDEIGAEKWESDYFVITKTKSYEKKTFDSKKFEKDDPTTYANYLKTSTVKGSIKTKFK